MRIHIPFEVGEAMKVAQAFAAFTKQRLMTDVIDYSQLMFFSPIFIDVKERGERSVVRFHFPYSIFIRVSLRVQIQSDDLCLVERVVVRFNYNRNRNDRREKIWEGRSLEYISHIWGSDPKALVE